MSLRVLIVSRRSWPQTGGSAGVLADLAEGLAQEGVAVTWLSPRWQHTWPLRMQIRGMHFVRLPYAPKNLWSSYHYFRALARYVRESAARFDVAYVSPSRGRIEFGWEGPLRVEGSEVPLGGHPRFDNPFVRAEHQASAYDVRYEGFDLRLDFAAPRRTVTGPR